MKTFAPLSRAFTLLDESPERTMTGIWLDLKLPRSVRQTSKPSVSAIIRSVMTTCGRTRSTVSKPSAPPEATYTLNLADRCSSR